jgi:predicted permease
METISQDLRYAIRSLVKTPGFAAVSIVTLALAIGVNTSIFSLVSAIVFADLPMQESETVAVVRGINPELDIDQGSVSPADFLDLRERQTSFASLSALTEGQWVLTGGDRPVRVSGLRITPGTFDVWRLPPVLGREFAPGEDELGASQVAMLSHGYWQDRFAGSPDVLGETLTLDGREHIIVGVAHPKLEFASFSSTQVLTPLVLERAGADRTSRHLFVSGRLAPGASQEGATAEMRRIGETLADEHPSANRGWALWSAPVMESLIDDQGNTFLLLLQLTVGMVILIACANVANMLLARATARSREFAVRSALGAGRRRLVRQLLTESLIISVSAAALGLGIAAALNRGLIWISAGTEPAFLMAELNGRVLAFTLLVSLVAPVVFGLLPALRASRAGPAAALRDGRSGDGGRAGKRTRGALVTAQISLALTLMIVAGLLTRTVIAMNTRPLGFDPSGLLAATVELPEAVYEDPEAVRVFYAEAREAVASLQGFGPVELTDVLPGAEFGTRRSLEVEGVVQPEGRAAPTAFFNTVSHGFFDMLGLPVRGGRGFTDADDATSMPVVVVSREVADRFWSGEDPVGRRIRVAGSDEWLQVVGVVADVRSSGESEQPAANLYVPHAQDRQRVMHLLSRYQGDPATAAGPIREAVWSIDSDVPLESVRTLERAQYEQAASSYALLSLFVIFALFALVMAAVGIYGVMAYSVSQRRSEIGLRMALGAEVGSVRWMVVSQGAKLLGLGVVIGLAAAFALSRLLANVVVGVSATDPLTFIGVPAVLALVTLAANLIPARRATRMDPATTLRAE